MRRPYLTGAGAAAAPRAFQLLSSQRKLEGDAFRFLQRREDAGKIRGGGAALRTQHAHQALSRYLRTLFELLKSDRRVDVVAQDDLAGSGIAVDDALNGFAQKCLTELRVPLRPRPK